MKRLNYIIQDKELIKEWNNEKNELLGYNPSLITKGSHKKVWWKCSECGHEWKAEVKTRARTDGKATGCPICGRKRLSEYHATPIQGVNDFESNYPELLKEWNYEKNKDLKPSQFLKKSGYKVWWKCSICGNEYKAEIRSKVLSGLGCPLCSRKRTGNINATPIQGVNDLPSVYPNILKEWNYEKNENAPSTYMARSNKKVWWKCEYGHEWEASIVNRVKGRNCPICKKEYKVSYPEKAIFYYIKKYYSNALENYTTKELKNKELDIYIPELKTAIEYDGFLWHKNIEKDKAKDTLCKNNDITLIRVREKGLPKLESSSIICEINPNRDNHEYLEDCIKWILNYLNLPLDKVNIEKDNEKILTLMHLSRKKNSLLKSRLDINLMWDYEKNKDLTPDMFTIGSEKIVWAKCTSCGKSYQIKIKDLYKKNTTRCIDCSKIKYKKGINDFKTKYPKLALEYDYERNKEKLEDLSLSKRRNSFYWKCSECGHEWKASIASRINSSYCPKCASKVGIKTRINNYIQKHGSIKTNYPELAKEWNYEKNKDILPELTTCNNKKVVWWKCSKCGHEWEKSVALRTKGFGRCPNCNNIIIRN